MDRDLARGDLARAAGITRQALHAIETDRYLPNVTIEWT